jgi:hypothetical protein
MTIKQQTESIIIVTELKNHIIPSILIPHVELLFFFFFFYNNGKKSEDSQLVRSC